MVNNGTRTFSSPIDLLLQVNIADLDPAQNPAGTRWFLMGTLFVGGEQDVSQASRWVEFVPSFNGTTFSFTYPNGSNGQLNFRTIPGLVDPGLSVGSVTADRTSSQPLSTFEVAFDRAIKPFDFTSDQISLVGPNGPVTITNANIKPIGPSNALFTVQFDAQGTLGVYTLTIGPGIEDTSGNPMQQAYTTQFTIEGPRIIAQTPTGTNNLPNAINHVRVTFNEAIDPSTLNTSDTFAHGPNGAIAITSVTAVSGANNTQFDINFAAQTKTGSYAVLVLPFVKDSSGNLMDQNENFIGGELPDDIYAAEFGITGPQVTATAPNSTTAGETYSLQVTFNEDINVSSFTTSQIASFTGPTGQDLRSQVFGIVQVSPTNFHQFNVLFTPQTISGTYTMVIGPNVQDVYGNPMDQDADAVLPVESGDAYTATFVVANPTVVSASPSGTVVPLVDHVRIFFGQAMDPTTFNIANFSFTGPDGPIDLTGVAAVAGSNNTQFDITFAPQFHAGTYALVINGVSDVYGNPLPTYTAQFAIAPFHVASISPSGLVPLNTNHVRLTFDRPVDATTFGTGQVSLTGPGGAVTVTAVTAVAGTNNTQFDVSFTPLSAVGNYTFTLSTSISDLYGNTLAAFSATLSTSSNLVVNGGFETGNFNSWTQSGDTGSTAVAGTFDGTAPHSGSFHAHFGPTGGLGFIAQTLSTIAGASYTLTFWLAHPYSDVGSGTEWLVRVGGNTLMDVTNAGNFNYTQFTFTFTATSSSTVLQFGFLEPPNYFFLDDVSVIAN
jgi:methionine-rich copper-binding protein CopC